MQYRGNIIHTAIEPQMGKWDFSTPRGCPFHPAIGWLSMIERVRCVAESRKEASTKTI